MKDLLRASALVALVMAATGVGPAGDIVFELHDVKMSRAGRDAGTLTGSFTTDRAMKRVRSIDIESDAKDLGALASAATRYNDDLLPAASVSSTPGLFRVGADPSRELLLGFAGGLRASGESSILVDVSRETHTTGGDRVVTSGYVRATTAGMSAPSPIAMGAVAIGAAGLAARRCRRRAA